MRTLMLLLVLLLARIGVIDGANPCFDKCQRGDNRVDVSGCGLRDDDIPDLVKCFEDVGRENIETLYLFSNELTTLPAGLFQGFVSLDRLSLGYNKLSTLPSGIFDGLGNLLDLFLYGNDLTTLPDGLFNELENLKELYLFGNGLSAVPSGLFDRLGNLICLSLHHNKLSDLPSGLFDGLGRLEYLELFHNELTTLPEGLFNDLEVLQFVSLRGNPDLQCVPYTGSAHAIVDDMSSDQCECTPAGEEMCNEGFHCAPGASGYTCEMAMHQLRGELHLSDARSTYMVKKTIRTNN